MSHLEGLSLEERQRMISAQMSQFDEPNGELIAQEEEPQDEYDNSDHEDNEDNVEEQKKEKVFQEGVLKEDISHESYLDRQDLHMSGVRDTKYSDSTRWGVKKEMYDEQKMEFGSYLEQHERNAKDFRTTTSSDSTRWGKSHKEPIFDETKLEQGSYLEKHQEFHKKRSEEELKKKMETIDSMKKKYASPTELQFSYDELKGKQFPTEVDPTKKEQYLNDNDFMEVFKMSKAQYNKLKPFKKRQLKIKADLF